MLESALHCQTLMRSGTTGSCDMVSLADTDAVAAANQLGNIKAERLCIAAAAKSLASVSLRHATAHVGLNSSAGLQMITDQLACWHRALMVVCSQPFAFYDADGGRSALFRVANVTAERRTGLFKPLTASGTIVVDGVVASVHSGGFADAAMDRFGLTHALPALYQVCLLTTSANAALGAAVCRCKPYAQPRAAAPAPDPFTSLPCSN